MYNNEGVDREFHSGECNVWYEEDCNCFVRSIDDYMFDKHRDDYNEWEDENPPRRSKTARPTHTESGRSVKFIQRIIGRKGKK